MDHTQKNILETALEALPRLGQVQDIAIGAANDAEVPAAAGVAIPDGMKFHDLTPAFEAIATKLQPWRRTGTAKLDTLDSFIAWANRHKGPTSAIFATAAGEKAGLTIIADYHGEGAPVMDHMSRDTKASHCRHRGTYAFPLSKEWQVWSKISGRPLSKAELGEFVETNAKDLMDPTPAMLGNSKPLAEWEAAMIDIARQVKGRFGSYGTLIDLSRAFEIHENSKLISRRNPDTGESTFQFLDEHSAPDGSPIAIPTLFLIAIPVFDYGAHYRIPVRFSYRKAGPEISFTLRLHNPDIAQRDAVDEAIATAAKDTGLPVFAGRPETE